MFGNSIINIDSSYIHLIFEISSEYSFINFDIIKKSGSWFSYGSERLGQGREKVKELVQNDPAFAKEIEDQIKAKIAQMQFAAREEKVTKPVEDELDIPKEIQNSVKITREEARRKLDIAVEDDED